jgi:cell wall-associated NlpC family hydrolase
VGVKSYRNWDDGIRATVQTLRQSNMSPIVQAFRSSDPQGVIHAIAGSPWGTSGSLVAQTIGQATGQRYAVGNAHIASAMSSPTNPVASLTPSAPAPRMGVDQALTNAMLQESAAPVTGNGGGNILTDAMSLIQQAGTTKTPAANAALVFKASADVSRAGVGGDAQKLLGMIHQVIGGGYNQANHADIGESAKQVRTQGTDCSGFISWLMGPQGLGLWQTSLATPSIDTAPGMQAGRGRQVTIWNNKQPGNAGHVFIQIGNQFFASEGGVGIRQISTAEAINYIQHGSDGGTYEPLHPRGL